MKAALVGNTGFVGSNLSLNYCFSGLYNSKNIKEAYGTEPELLVYAGVPAEKFLANQSKCTDCKIIENAFMNIQRIKPKKVVLISTIDVYENPICVNEDTIINTNKLQPYGANRYLLETKVRTEYPDALIVRLPGLFGINIKKNFIYDFINLVPSLLKDEKYYELIKIEPQLKQYYTNVNNGFHKCNSLDIDSNNKLKAIFESLGFTALNFTDSRGKFQFYNLEHLWNHIEFALINQITLFNIATEPIEIGELYQYLTGSKFINYIAETFPYYDFRSKYDTLMGGENGYLYDKQTILKEIKNFVQGKIL